MAQLSRERKRSKRWLFAEPLEVRVVPANVVVFDDDTYVDTSSGGTGAESDNIQASLTSLGHTVTTFTGITDTDFSTALTGQDLLVIPEQEHGSLGPNLSAGAISVIQNYVSG